MSAKTVEVCKVELKKVAFDEENIVLKRERWNQYYMDVASLLEKGF